MITGIAVAGFGAGALVTAPIATRLIESRGVQGHRVGSAAVNPSMELVQVLLKRYRSRPLPGRGRRRGR
jgi:hypothetical protein